MIMLIQPIIPQVGIGNLKGLNSLVEKGSEVGGFQNILQEAMDNVQATAEKTEENTVKLALGQVDDLHNVTIDIAKAQLSMQLMVQLRNKALDVYSEMMRLNV